MTCLSLPMARALNESASLTNNSCRFQMIHALHGRCLVSGFAVSLSKATSHVSASDDGIVDLWEFSKSPAWRRHDFPGVGDMSWFTLPNGDERLTIASVHEHEIIDPDTGNAVRCDAVPTGSVIATSDGTRVFTLTAKGSLRTLESVGARPETDLDAANPDPEL